MCFICTLHFGIVRST